MSKIKDIKKELLRPSVARDNFEKLFSNYLKEKVTVLPLYEYQNSVDVEFEENNEAKAYKLFYLLTRAKYKCREIRVEQSPVNNKFYLIITFDTNITELENYKKTA